MDMAGKGKPKTGGRAKGTTNKLTADVKAMVLQALHNKGGVAYLENQADANPVAFLTLVGKVLPMTVAGEDGGAVVIRVVTGVPEAQ